MSDSQLWKVSTSNMGNRQKLIIIFIKKNKENISQNIFMNATHNIIVYVETNPYKM